MMFLIDTVRLASFDAAAEAARSRSQIRLEEACAKIGDQIDFRLYSLASTQTILQDSIRNARSGNGLRYLRNVLLFLIGVVTMELGVLWCPQDHSKGTLALTLLIILGYGLLIGAVADTLVTLVESFKVLGRCRREAEKAACELWGVGAKAVYVVGPEGVNVVRYDAIGSVEYAPAYLRLGSRFGDNSLSMGPPKCPETPVADVAAEIRSRIPD